MIESTLLMGKNFSGYGGLGDSPGGEGKCCGNEGGGRTHNALPWSITINLQILFQERTKMSEAETLALMVAEITLLANHKTKVSLWWLQTVVGAPVGTDSNHCWEISPGRGGKQKAKGQLHFSLG